MKTKLKIKIGSVLIGLLLVGTLGANGGYNKYYHHFIEVLGVQVLVPNKYRVYDNSTNGYYVMECAKGLLFNLFGLNSPPLAAKNINLFGLNVCIVFLSRFIFQSFHINSLV